MEKIYIDDDFLISKVTEKYRYSKGEARKAYRDVIDMICAAPTADVQEVKHGKWCKSDIPNEKFVCSVCGGACWYYDYKGEVARSNYCPNCGAKMDAKENEK